MEVVLEVATGRRPVDDDGTVVVDWVWDLWEKGKLSEAADPRLMGKFNAVEMEIMLLEKARPITRHTLTWSRSHQPHLRGVDRGLKNGFLRKSHQRPKTRVTQGAPEASEGHLILVEWIPGGKMALPGTGGGLLFGSFFDPNNQQEGA